MESQILHRIPLVGVFSLPAVRVLRSRRCAEQQKMTSETKVSLLNSLLYISGKRGSSEIYLSPVQATFLPNLPFDLNSVVEFIRQCVHSRPHCLYGCRLSSRVHLFARTIAAADGDAQKFLQRLALNNNFISHSSVRAIRGEGGPTFPILNANFSFVPNVASAECDPTTDSSTFRFDSLPHMSPFIWKLPSSAPQTLIHMRQTRRREHECNIGGKHSTQIHCNKVPS